MALHYLLGDATEPIHKPCIITHICNDCRPGKWGAGFVMALSKKNDAPEKAYRKWSVDRKTVNDVYYELGNFILVPFVGKEIIVANIIGQHGVLSKDNIIPIRYSAVKRALRKIYDYAENNGYSVSMPRMGADLAGGSWNVIESIITDSMGDVETYVYTLPFQKDKWPQTYENEDKVSDVKI